MEPILDFHTHAQDVLNKPTEKGYLRAWRKTFGQRGPIWAWERSGFHPAMVKSPTRALQILGVLEGKVRLSGASARNLVSAMAQHGIGRAVVLPVEPVTDSQKVLRMAQVFPGLIPFASVDPKQPDAPSRLDALLSQGAKGVKFHPIIQQTPPEDPTWRPLMEVAAAHGVPVISHCGSVRFGLRRRPSDEFGNPLRFVPLLEAFPKQTFVLAHMGFYERDEALEIARRFEQVYMDTSFQHHAHIRRVGDELGADRLVFGTDWPATDPAAVLRQVRKAGFDDRDTEKILWANAERLLGLEARH